MINNILDFETVKHKSGLNVILLPLRDYNTSYALLGANYGSVDTEFKVNGKKICVPAGTAHFLEHKLFENEDNDAFDEYAKTGASANAYTSFDKTCYLFRTSDNFEKSLEILLKYTLNPYFTDKTVKKEQGIIAEEIKMYQDNPSWRVFFGMLGGLYHNHPVKTDIAGTVESIGKITPEILYNCFNAFYNPHNMVLAVSGKVDKDEVLAVCDKMIKETEEVKVEKVFCEEPDEVVEREIYIDLPVSSAVYGLAFKGKIDKKNILRTELLGSLALDVFAGDISSLYRDMYEKGLVNNSFSTEVFSGNDYLSFVFEGEGGNPERVRERIFEEIKRFNTDFPKDLFETAKRELYGRQIRACDSIEGLSSLAVSMYFSGYEPDRAIKELETITAEEVENYIKTSLLEDKSTLCVAGKGDK